MHHAIDSFDFSFAVCWLPPRQVMYSQHSDLFLAREGADFVLCEARAVNATDLEKTLHVAFR